MHGEICLRKYNIYVLLLKLNRKIANNNNNHISVNNIYKNISHIIIHIFLMNEKKMIRR